MPYTIVLTICSGEKNRSKKLLPARERYLGTHIGAAIAYGKSNGELPVFILSGKHGLLSADQVVEYYDYRLREQDMKDLKTRLYSQLGVMRVREVRFLVKNKLSWRLYREALEFAAAPLGIKVTNIELPDAM